MKKSNYNPSLLFAIIVSIISFNAFAQSSTKCPDFDHPVKLPRPPGGGYIKVKKSIDICAPELRKEAQEVDKNIKQLKKDYKAAIDSELKDYRAINKKTEERIYNQTHRTKIRWNPTKVSCGKHAQNRCLHLFSVSKVLKNKYKGKDNADALETKQDKLELADDSALSKSMEGFLSEAMASFKEHYQNKQPWIVYEPGSKIPSAAPSKIFPQNPTDAEWEVLISKKLPGDKAPFLSDFISKFPRVNEIDQNLGKAKEEKKHILQLAKQLCNTKDLNACPQVKREFQDDPSIETFKKMITTLGRFRYTDKQDQGFYESVVTLDNYDQFESNKKFSENSSQIEKIKEAKEKAEKALRNFESNQKNAKDVNYKPLPVSSQCGSCNDLKKLVREATEQNDREKLESLRALDQEIHCNVLNKVDSCKEKVSNILKNNKFTYQGNPNQSDKSITFEMALKSYMDAPQIRKESFEAAFAKVNAMVSEENGKLEECVSCNSISSKLEELAQPEYIENANANPEEEEYTKVWTLKPGNEGKKEAFEGLRDIAVRKKCIDPGDFKIQTELSCLEKTAVIKDIINSHESMDDLSFDEKDQLDSELDALQDYQKEKKLDCCDQVVGDLSTDIFQDKKSKDYNIVRENSAKLQLAEALNCIKCGIHKNPETLGSFDQAKNSHTSCDMYKKDIAGKKDTDLVAGMKKPDGSNYTVGEFKKNEVYPCSDGPKSSLLRPNADWETREYSPFGKYGDLYDSHMMCIVAPGSTGAPEAVNLSCCQLEANDPYFESLKQTLQGAYAPPAEVASSVTNWETLSADKRAQSFCNNIFATYQAKKSSEVTKGWQVCVDNKNRTLLKVDSEAKFDVNSSSSNISVPESSSPASGSAQ